MNEFVLIALAVSVSINLAVLVIRFVERGINQSMERRQWESRVLDLERRNKGVNE